MQLIVMLALYLLFLPPIFYCPEVPTTDADAPVIDYVVNDRVPLPSSFQASRATSPLPHIAYLSIFIYCTMHMLLRYFPIRIHSLSLSPLVVPFPISYAAYTYILHTIVNPAPC